MCGWVNMREVDGPNGPHNMPNSNIATVRFSEGFIHSWISRGKNIYKCEYCELKLKLGLKCNLHTYSAIASN